LRGPYDDRGRWTIRWTDDSGKARCFSRADRPEVEARAEELRQEAAQGAPQAAPQTGPPLVPMPAFDGTPGWWRRSFGAILAASEAAVNAGDVGTLARLRRHASTARDLAGAWCPYSAHEAVETALEDTLNYIEGMRRRAVVENVPGPPLGFSDRPDDPVCRPMKKN